MLRSVHTAATGMEAMQTNLDNIANNLANVNTTGFKKSEAAFQDLFYQTIREPGAAVSTEARAPVGVQVGSGVRTAGVSKNFDQGPVKLTNNALDLAMSGDGFFMVQQEGGELAYTRDGSFKTDAQGRIQNSNGLYLVPQITIPPGIVKVTVAPTGSVTVTDQDGKQQQVGQIEIATFVNDRGLSALGNNLFQPTEASGQPTNVQPGSSGAGVILAGHLEGSNVNIVNEMVDMIKGQRAYEMNSKVVQAADQMLQVSVNVLK